MSARRLSLLLVGAGLACAPLRLTGKSEHCQRMYDACLNACPQPPRADPIAPKYNDLQIDIAACTDRCNQDAKKCQ